MTPLSYLLCDALLSSIYSYHAGISIGNFLVAYALMFLALFITLSGKIYKVATINPAEALKTE